MVNRYNVVWNSEDMVYDIYDAVKGIKLFCSFPKKVFAEKKATELNSKADAQKLAGFELRPYIGPVRSVKNATYRTPKGRKIDSRPAGRCGWVRVEDGRVAIEYV